MTTAVRLETVSYNAGDRPNIGMIAETGGCGIGEQNNQSFGNKILGVVEGFLDLGLGL